MNKLILIMSFAALLSACGKKDGGRAVTEVNGNDPISARDIDSFVGVYDLLTSNNEVCGASIQIVKVCDGVQVRSNTLENKSYCNINKGEIRTGDNRSSTNVTFENNILKSVSLIFNERSTPPGDVKEIITNKLSTDENGNLVKELESPKGLSSCVYEKR